MILKINVVLYNKIIQEIHNLQIIFDNIYN